MPPNREALTLAFAKLNKTDFDSRFAEAGCDWMEARTAHSFGYSILRRYVKQCKG